jgi:hypothetical protein
MFSVVKGVKLVDLNFLPLKRRLFKPHGRGLMRLRSVNWGGGDELPNCFLERRRLGRPLPCTVRLRAQRSDHMAVV